MKYMDMSKIIYEKKYSDGYGINIPESHVIRIINYLKRSYISTKNNIKVLDFGCGNGTHSLYFESLGWESFGLDISENAIKECRKKLDKTRFSVIQPGESILDIFSEKFDIIFANQSLYYLTNQTLNNTLHEMNKILKTDGVVVFTMMGSSNYYYSKIDKTTEQQDGLCKVLLGGRLEEEAYINFITDETELLSKFSLFEKILVGYYDFLMEEGSSFHYYYIGKKKEL